MALDGEGHEIATDEVYLIAGRVRRIDGDTVLIAIGERGEKVIRVAAEDVVRVASTLGGGGGTTDHGALSGLADDDHPQYVQKSAGAFDTVAPSSAVAGSTSNHLTRVAEVNSLMDGLLAAAFVLFQAQDATLTALAGLATGANKLPYFTGADTVAQTDLTAFVRTLLDDADASTARATLGVTIGTHVQAHDDQLAAIAALSPNSGDMLFFDDGEGTWNLLANPGAPSGTHWELRHDGTAPYWEDIGA